MSVKNKAMGTPYGVYYIQPSLASNILCSLVGRVNYIFTSAWGFQHCSFRQTGQCESLDKWNEQQTGSTFSFLYIHVKYFKLCLGGDRGLSYQQKTKFMKQNGGMLKLSHNQDGCTYWVLCNLKKMCLLLSLFVLGTVFSSSKAETVSVDGMEFGLVQHNGEAYLLPGSYAGDVVVPSQITVYDEESKANKTYKVVNLSIKCFYKNTEVTSVKIPSTVRSLSESCFEGATNLKSVAMTSSVVSVGKRCFQECSSLESITFSSSVKELPEHCFYGCSSLKAFPISENVKKIGDACFYECAALEKIVIPSSVTEMEALCFYGCKALKSVDNLASITTLPSSCFTSCISLEAVNVPSTVECLGLSCFGMCKSLKQITIPESVTELGHGCFGWSGLTSVVIPSSIKSLSEQCFRDCVNLASVILPEGLKEIKSGCFSGCSALNDIRIPLSVETIEGCFSGTGLVEVVIPSHVKNFECDFAHCKNLKTAVILAPTDKLQNSSFYYCENLVSVTLPETLTSIEGYSFALCSKLADINIPKGVTVLGKECFDRCSALEKIELPTSLLELGDGCFQNCKKLILSSIPSSVTTLGSRCFSGCVSISNLLIPETVTTIGEMCFEGCRLESVCIPSSVKTIGGGVLWNGSDNSIAKRDFLTVSYAITPPVCSESKYSMFHGFNPEQRTLYVPEQSVNLYKAASDWSEFGKILPIPDQCTSPSIKVDNQVLTMTSPDKDAQYYYSITNKDEATCRYSETGIVKLNNKYTIKGYSKVKGKLNSPEAMTTCVLSNGQMRISDSQKEMLLNAHSDSEELQKCAKPTITYDEGTLNFSCDTPNARFYYSISDNSTIGNTKYEGGVLLTPQLEISVYAVAEGYGESELANVSLCLTPENSQTTSIEKVEAKQLASVSTSNGKVYMDGLKGKVVRFYGLDGKYIGKAHVKDGKAIFATNQKLLIAYVDGGSIKIAVH